ncbi:MAG: hypothetical protein H8K10_15460 [Nitrospira sp.]|nr:hypothetical protein [Nitrospira sp.]
MVTLRRKIACLVLAVSVSTIPLIGPFGSVHAAITVVQSKGDCTAGNFSSTTCTFPSNVTPGNVVAACGAIWNGGNMTGQALTDTVLTDYTEVVGVNPPAGTPNKTWIAYGVVPSSGANTVTQAPAGGTGWFGSWGIVELSGVDTSSPIDVDGLNLTGNSTAPSDSITTSAADAIVLACMSHGGGAITITADTGGGWTALGEIEGTSNAPYAWEYQIFSSAGAKTAYFAIGASVGWTVQTLSLKQSSATVTQPIFRRGFSIPGMNSTGLGGPLP